MYGSLPSSPGLMSFTKTVPASVPSLFQSSVPCTPSSAAKKKVFPMAILGVVVGAEKPAGIQPSSPGYMSLIRVTG